MVKVYIVVSYNPYEESKEVSFSMEKPTFGRFDEEYYDINVEEIEVSKETASLLCNPT